MWVGFNSWLSLLEAHSIQPKQTHIFNIMMPVGHK